MNTACLTCEGSVKSRRTFVNGTARDVGDNANITKHLPCLQLHLRSHSALLTTFMEVRTTPTVEPVAAPSVDVGNRLTGVPDRGCRDALHMLGQTTYEWAAGRIPSLAPLRVISIETEEQFLHLRDEWNRLARSRRNRSVFFLHEWFHAAWDWRKHDSTLLILCAYAGDALVGVLPLIANIERTGLLPLRRLELLTVPDTQLCDLIVAEDQTDSVVAAFVDELTRRRSHWDELRLDYLTQSALAGTAFRDALSKRGFPSEIRDRGRNLAVALETSWADYYSTRSRSLKKANNLAGNRLKKRGEVAVEWLEPGARDSSAIEVALNGATAISRRSWKRDTGNTLDQPGPGAFIRRLSELASREGWLSMWTLKLNGEPLAMEYQLIYEGQVHALRADFDSSCTDVSPGSYLSHHLLQELFKRGLKRYCMGPGENPYKLRWSSEGDRLGQLVVYGRTLRGRAQWLREAVVKPRVKRLITKLRPSTGQPVASGSPQDSGVEE